MDQHPFAELTREILSCAYEVHNGLGPGFLESVYEHALAREFRLRGIPFQRQAVVPVYYKEEQVGEHHLDLVVDGQVVVELKAIDELAEIHTSIVLSYLAAAQLSVALILNFRKPRLQVKRLVK